MGRSAKRYGNLAIYIHFAGVACPLAQLHTMLGVATASPSMSNDV